MILLLVYLLVIYALAAFFPWFFTYGPLVRPLRYINRSPWNWRCLFILPFAYENWLETLPENKL
jgi:hypothetical protein